jgi:hypothetical protein
MEVWMKEASMRFAMLGDFLGELDRSPGDFCTLRGR